jgi:glycosyltransferase involved in cell wall biosynthesis
LGSLPDLVMEGETGLLFEPGNPQDLADKVEWFLEHEEETREMGRRAREEYKKKYTPAKNFDLLMKIYEEAINSARNEKTF